MIAEHKSAKSVFLEAVESCTPDQWGAFLDRACAGDAGLRQRVQILLQAHLGTDSLLDAAGPAPADDADLADGPGRIIGPYKLLQMIGEGGMGAVYLAEQERPVRRKVALKIIKLGMDTKDVIARFEAERQALALMDHPNIAKVFDAGAIGERGCVSAPWTGAIADSASSRGADATPLAGRPYFVMELVKGIPITEFCDENQLTPRERLELFVPVCQAIQHAHQKGIIHRDLKPSNVLVTLYDGVAVPKVIDFGVAKATDQRLTERTLFTRHGQVIGTVEYMAPEQATFNALDVDTRSDVYSLGVLLYELLTGLTPLDKEKLRTAAFAEMLRVIREEEPPKPSTRLSQSGPRLARLATYRRTESQRLPKLMRGELDWIVMKALEKDRGRRYATASGLAADIERYLHDEPVEACPPSAGYRLRKFARKHRPLLTAAAAFGLLLAVAAAVSTWLAVRATVAEADADRQRDQALTLAVQAQTNEQTAGRERDAAQAARDDLRRSFYAAQMRQAQDAWDGNLVGRVQEILDQTRPGPGETDLRGFEWHYWDRQCHADLRTIALPGAKSRIAALSPDGTRYAALVPAADDTQPPVVKVWDVATAKEIVSLTVPETAKDDLNGELAFSRDGRRLALRVTWWTATAPEAERSNGRLVVWDAVSTKALFTLRGPLFGPLTLSGDGGRVATIVAQQTKVWDVGTGRELAVADGGPVSPLALALSPDGTVLAVTAYRPDTKTYELLLSDAATGKVRATIPRPGYSVSALAFTPDGSRLASLGWGPAQGGPTLPPRVWVTDVAAGRDVRSFPSDVRPTMWRLAYSPDGGRLVQWPRIETGGLIIWDTGTGRRQPIKGHADLLTGVVFSADGTCLYSADTGGTVKVWDAAAEGRTDAALLPDARTVVSPDGAWRATFHPGAPPANGPPAILVTDAAGQAVATVREHAGAVRGVRFSPDGRHGISTDDAGGRLVWEAATGHVRLAQAWPATKASQVRFHYAPPQFSADGCRVAAGEPDGSLKVWDLAGGTAMFTVPGKDNDFALSPDGRRLATTARAGLTVWDVVVGRECLVRPNGRFPVFSPDGARLAWTAFNGGETRLTVTDIAADDDVLTVPVRGPFPRPAFSPDGTRLAAAEPAPLIDVLEIGVWDVAGGRRACRVLCPAGRVREVAFSPDGRRLATLASPPDREQSQVRLWDVATGQEVLTLDTQRRLEAVTQLAFSRDGHRLLAEGRLLDDTDWQEVWDATPRAVGRQTPD